jgi:hypothetical protein
MDNVLTRFRDRMQARKLRRRLTPEGRRWLDRATAEIWCESGDVGEAESITAKTLEMQGRQLGFDPATIVLLIQIAVLIYKTLKALNVLKPSPETVSAIFESEDDQG